APLHRGGTCKEVRLICPTAQGDAVRHIGTTGESRMTACDLPGPLPQHHHRWSCDLLVQVRQPGDRKAAHRLARRLQPGDFYRGECPRGLTSATVARKGPAARRNFACPKCAIWRPTMKRRVRSHCPIVLRLEARPSSHAITRSTDERQYG